MQSDQLHVPALFHFHFIVNGNRLSQEPACRFFGGFLVLLHCCRNLHVSFDNRRVSFNLISSSTGYGDRNFGYFLGSFHRPTPVRYNWSVFARKMHSTSEFAKIVRSKCVIHAGFVIVSWTLRGIPFQVGEWIFDLISEFTFFQPSNSFK